MSLVDRPKPFDLLECSIIACGRILLWGAVGQSPARNHCLFTCRPGASCVHCRVARSCFGQHSSNTNPW